MENYLLANDKPLFAFPFKIVPTACSLKAGEITCLVRVPFVPKARRNNIPGKDFF